MKMVFVICLHRSYVCTYTGIVDCEAKKKGRQKIKKMNNNCNIVIMIINYNDKKTNVLMRCDYINYAARFSLRETRRVQIIYA